jgi:hypothetical protein
MPSLIRVGVGRARDLPLLDSSMQGDAYTDAYVEVRLGDEVKRTQTYRKSLNPIWNEDFRFEVMDDSSLQEAPLELKVVDQDLYSSELIGMVYIDLNPLIMRTIEDTDKNLVMQGWFPLFDTTKGLRGELHVTVKLQFIGNDNPFQDSSAGVQFFNSSSLSPHAFIVREILGFVDDLVVDTDPESSWSDYFRKSGQASKVSNESRQKVLYGLSAEVRREVGKKVLDMGGNAVLGFSIQFDLEGASGLVVRANGTACHLLKVLGTNSVQVDTLDNKPYNYHTRGIGAVLLQGIEAGLILADSTGSMLGYRNSSHSHSHSVLSSENAIALAPLPLGCGLPLRLSTFGTVEVVQNNPRFRDLGEVFSSPEWNTGHSAGVSSSVFPKEAIFQEDVCLLTLTTFESFVNVRLGGLVVARAVKFLGKLEATLSDQDTREGWWNELRDEIKGHARTLCCTHVIGYREMCSLVGDVCVISAEGTAAVVKNLSCPALTSADWESGMNSTAEFEKTDTTATTTEATIAEVGEDKDKDKDKEKENDHDYGNDHDDEDQFIPPMLKRMESKHRKKKMCTAVHVPYNRKMAPFSFMRLVPCALCKRKWVPEIVMSTTQLPEGLPIRGVPRLLEARVCRQRRRAVGEADATKVSEMLPFVEFDLQRQLMLKLKVTGLNAAFGYQSNIRVGGDLVIAIATCTAVFVTALPSPPVVQIIPPSQLLSGSRIPQEKRLMDMQLHLEEIANYHQSALRSGEIQGRSRYRLNQGHSVGSKSYLEKDENRNSSSSSSSTSSSSSSSSSDDESGSSSSSLESPSSSSSSSGDDEDDSSSSSSSSSEDDDDKAKRRLASSGTKFRERVTNRTRRKEGRKARLRRILLDERTPTVIEVDDETDADIETVLCDWISPLGMDMTNLHGLPVPTTKSYTYTYNHTLLGNGRQVMVLRRENLAKAKPGTTVLASRLTSLFYDAYLRLCHTVRAMQPCQVLGVSHSLHLLDDGVLEVLMTAAVHPVRYMVRSPSMHGIVMSSAPWLRTRTRSLSVASNSSKDNSMYSEEGVGAWGSGRKLSRVRTSSVGSAAGSDYGDASSPQSPSTSRQNKITQSYDKTNDNDSPVSPRGGNDDGDDNETNYEGRSTRSSTLMGAGVGAIHPPKMSLAEKYALNQRQPQQQQQPAHDWDTGNTYRNVFLTPLPYMPGATVRRYLGPIHLHFVKDSESSNNRDPATLEQFFFVFLSEACAVVRSQVTALGGNALLCHHMYPQESTRRGQQYKMISITGDAVLLDFDSNYQNEYQNAKNERHKD